ncbi:MAG: hypothetical protein Q4G16_11365 [Cruoricaptor ignavus]|nr:hypothetical protein [Cruoricaptor ignavus]
MAKTNRLGDFVKNLTSENKELTPMQEIKKGIVKPVEKTFLLSIQEDKLIALKRLALDKKTSVRQLINYAIEEKYFK